MTCWGRPEECPEPNGECPDCGEPTYDGEAVYTCVYSPQTCETCGARPCDRSC
jgi:hypothetical protein